MKEKSHCRKGCMYTAKTTGVGCCGYAQRELGRKTVLLTVCETYQIEKDDFPAIKAALEKYGCPCYKPGRHVSAARALNATKKPAERAQIPESAEHETPRSAALEDLEQLLRSMNQSELRYIYETLKQKYGQ